MNRSTSARNSSVSEFQLLHRRVQAVVALDVLAAQRLEQLDLVVAGHAERGPGRHHAHDQAQHARRVGSPVDQVADEDGAPLWMAGAYRAPGGVTLELVPQRHQQLLELGPAAVHVADDVERAALVLEVAEQPGAGDRGGVDLLGGAQHVHGAEPLAPEVVAGRGGAGRAGGGARAGRSPGPGGWRSAPRRASPAGRARSPPAARRARGPARRARGGLRAARWWRR